jgi:hypothetical protein
VGTKNLLGITTSVHCVAGVVDYVVKLIERDLLHAGGDTQQIFGAHAAIGIAVACEGIAFQRRQRGLPTAPPLNTLPLATKVPAPLPPLEGYTFAGYRNGYFGSRSRSMSFTT